MTNQLINKHPGHHGDADRLLKSKDDLNRRAAIVNERIINAKAAQTQILKQLDLVRQTCIEKWGTDNLDKLRDIYRESVKSQNEAMNNFHASIEEAEKILDQIDIEINGIEQKYAK